MESALHEAAREGRADVVRVLLKEDVRVAYKVNLDYETALFVACTEGHLHVVNQLLPIDSLIVIDFDRPDERTSLHAAAERGHADVVKAVIKARGGLVKKADRQGATALHSAVSHGHLEVTREILSADPELSLVLDGSGRSPLHIAALKGRLRIVHELLTARPDSAYVLTSGSQTFLHYAVETNQIEVVKHVVDVFNTSHLITKQDDNGDTVLHVATRNQLTQMVRWLVSCTSVNVNAVNNQGVTALDILEKDATHSGAMIIAAALKEAQAQRGYELPKLADHSSKTDRKRGMNSITQLAQAQLFETGYQVNDMAKDLRNLHKEGIKNAGNTVTVVAVLIATVAFSAMFTVPGGLNNDKGTAAMANTVAFKVFVITDTVALFSSLMIVLILVTVVPFHRKVVLKFVFLINKILWVAVGCTASAFLAAGYVVVAPETMWVAVSMCVVGGASMAFILSSLTWLVTKHQMKKARLRKSKKRTRLSGKAMGRSFSVSRSRSKPLTIITKGGSGGDEDEMSMKSNHRRSRSSSDSDFESSGPDGYHPV
ncbi:hypothetical protein KI387_018217 [Taxus chinensis]|uniref:PGG domain-containing protein n=1 Tax=Taxus chinensis TaxID=29808 RepID=A0AA38GKY0_TAXCH|nr:hypothetical protein KI387_018217 [Taxus chinensis]